jgi:hypothetical protein
MFRRRAVCDGLIAFHLLHPFAKRLAPIGAVRGFDGFVAKYLGDPVKQRDPAHNGPALSLGARSRKGLVVDYREPVRPLDQDIDSPRSPAGAC